MKLLKRLICGRALLIFLAGFLYFLQEIIFFKKTQATNASLQETQILRKLNVSKVQLNSSYTEILQTRNFINSNHNLTFNPSTDSNLVKVKKLPGAIIIGEAKCGILNFELILY